MDDKLNHKSALVLLDNRVGNNNQSIALAKQIFTNHHTIQVNYVGFLIKLPTIIFFIMPFLIIFASDIKKYLNIFKQNPPDAIISAGRRLSIISYYLKLLAKKNGKDINVIHIMKPSSFFIKRFAISIIPYHDKISKEFKSPSNGYQIIRSFGSLNILEKEKLEQEAFHWKDKLSKYKNPKIALILGGDTKDNVWQDKDVETLIQNISNNVNLLGGSLLIATSRRTSQSSVGVIKKYLENNKDIDFYFYDWMESSGNNNPYFALLELSDIILVTGDSVSICSEASIFDKPVYIYDKKGIVHNKKYKKFHNFLYENNYANKYQDKLDVKQNTKAFDETKRIGDLVIKYLKTNEAK